MAADGPPRREDPGQRDKIGRTPTKHRRPQPSARTLRVVVRLICSASPLGVLAVVLLTVAGGLVPAVTAWLTRSVLNDLAAGGHGPGHLDIRRLVTLAAILGVVGLVSGVMPQAQNYLQAQARRQIGLAFQDRMYRAINSFPGLSRFESPVFQDKIRIAQNVVNANPYQLVGSTLQMGQAAITAVSFIGFLEVTNPVLTAIVAATAVPVIVAEIVMSRTEARVQWNTTPASRRQFFYGSLLADAKAAKEVRLFGLGDFLRNRMVRDTKFINAERRAVDRRILGVQSSLEVLSSVVSAAGLIWTVREATAGRLSIGDVSMFIAAVAGTQNGISNVVAQFGTVYQSLLLLGHFVDIISAQPDLAVAGSPQPAAPMRSGIELRDVWFRYDTGHPWVLRGVSMYIPFGKTVAIIGLNGAGKTTLVKLLCRMYDVQRGSIRWDDADIRALAPEDLRERIGTVFQDYMTYDLTAAENVGIGDLSRIDDRAAVRHAAAQAGIDDALASLPQEYDTMLSRIFLSNKDKKNPETGVVLSGGQWQRVALARGLMRADRDLLILDEPSSGLDAEAEHAIHRQLRAIRKGRTSVLISHRLGSVRDADIIFVLAGGRIAERGTHEELMAARGEYHKLFQLQASGYHNTGSAIRGAVPRRDGLVTAAFRGPDGRNGAQAPTAVRP
jgi:ATP-binding cassette subfamily B protein